MESNVCLVIIFNHRYDANIPKLYQIYADKFKTIKFLVPFYDGNDQNVVPVFESSYQFHGYLIQSLNSIYEKSIEYYVFIADDMILNPNISEKNIIEEFCMKDKSAFISTLNPLNADKMFTWPHTRHSVRPFTRHDTTYKEYLMDYKEALKRMEDHFGDFSEFYEDVFLKILKQE